MQPEDAGLAGFMDADVSKYRQRADVEDAIKYPDNSIFQIKEVEWQVVQVEKIDKYEYQPNK